MFANTQMGGMNLGFPDVCLTPAAPAPIPTPYPNISMGPTALEFVPNLLWEGTPTHNMSTTVPLSLGDNAGLMGGVASGTDMGPTRHLTGSFTVLVGGMPGTRMTSMSMQNSTNSVGAALVPSQTKVLLLAP